MALSRKSRRSVRRTKRSKMSRRRVRKQRGGGILTLKIAQAPVLSGRPARGTPAAAAAAAATAAVGNITMAGAAPPDVTGFSSPAKSQKIMFTTATAATSITATVKHKNGADTTVNIPVSVAPALGTGTGIRADVNGNNVTIFNVSSGASGLNILGGDSGDFSLNVV